MTAKSAMLTATALAVLVILGAICAASPEFKAHATTVAIVILGVLALPGVLSALITPLLAAESAPQIVADRPDPAAAAQHTGSLQ